MRSDILVSARSPASEEQLQKRRTELDDVAMEISNSINRREEAAAAAAAGEEAAVRKHLGSRKRKKHKKKRKKKKEPVKFKLGKFKFIEEVDDHYVMEYGLTLDEIMTYRKNHFHLDREPEIMVRETKSSEMKEEFGTYCGVKKTIKNWLFWV